jgi:hypothetical protein
MWKLTPFVCLLIVLGGCYRNLPEETTLFVDASSMQFMYGGSDATVDCNYFYPSDSNGIRQKFVDELKTFFREKGDDVQITEQADFTLQIISCSFIETIDEETAVNSAGTITDTLDVHSIRVYMRCMLIDNRGGAVSIMLEAHSSDEEDVKAEPGFFHDLFFDDPSSFTPRTKRIKFPEKNSKRVLRRIHRKSLCEMKERLK